MCCWTASKMGCIQRQAPAKSPTKVARTPEYWADTYRLSNEEIDIEANPYHHIGERIDPIHDAVDAFSSAGIAGHFHPFQ